MTSERIAASELLSAAIAYTQARERVEALLVEAVEWNNPLDAAWLAQRIVDALEEECEANTGA